MNILLQWRKASFQPDVIPDFQLRTMDSFSEGLLHEEKIKDTQEHRKKTKKHPFGLRYIQIIPDPSRLQNWFKGKSAGRPDIFRSNSQLPVHISHKPSQGLKDEQVPTGIFGMRE
jgi:hypothetical protein